MPPEHTLIIKGHITSSISNKTQQRINRHLRHCIITSIGDAHVMMGSKHIDPALCIYIGAYLIYVLAISIRETKFLGGMEHYAKF
jgi:hypothetical protein